MLIRNHRRTRFGWGKSSPQHYSHGEKYWRASFARCQGSSHVASGVPCQDQTCAFAYPDGVHVIALSDGAGSAKLSHYGAYLVINRSAALVAEKFDSFFSFQRREVPIQKLFIRHLQHDVAQLSILGIDVNDADRERLGLPSRYEQLLVSCGLKELSSTFLIVAVKGNRYVVLHLGDGVVGYEYRDSRNRIHLEALSNPNNGEFANETIFVTSSLAEESVKLYCGRIDAPRKYITGFILMSDGPEASLYHKSSRRLAPACGKLLEACRSLPQDEMNEQLYKALENVISKKTSDDCSIALLARKDQKEE